MAIDLKKWARGAKTMGGKTDAATTANRSAAFDHDYKFAQDAMAKARAYVTDFDKDGKKATVIRDLLDSARRRVEGYDNGGPKATEMLRDITSIQSQKIGPASRAMLEGQKDHAPKKSLREQDAEADKKPSPAASTRRLFGK